MDSIFDIKLIKEFEKVRAFYDRNDPYFKNKIYVNQAWENIAEKFGYNASLLKDRMLQLRNRFNLEKRKLESLRNENNPNPVSSWPLFEKMSFLEGHIRSRKSYKMIMREMMHRENAGANDSSATRDEYESDDQINSDEDVHLVYDNLSSKQENSHDPHEIDETVAQYMVPELSEASPSSSLPPPPPMKRQKIYPNEPQLSIQSVNSIQRDHFPSMNFGHSKIDKFQNFGQFIASSLADLPEDQALNLIEKFTTDIVTTMKSNIIT